MNFFLRISILIFCLLAYFWYLASQGHTLAIPQVPVTKLITQLYVHTSQVPISHSTQADIREVIGQRLACYSQSPLGRLGSCNSDYVRALVRVGREKIASTPDLGLFIPAVADCPITYSLCKGTGKDTDECTNEENKCIDSVFDLYWRGSPQPIK